MSTEPMSIDELRAVRHDIAAVVETETDHVKAVHRVQRGPMRSKLSHSFSAHSPLSSGGTPESTATSGLSSSSSASQTARSSYFPAASTPRAGSVTSAPAVDRDHFQKASNAAYFANLEFVYPTPSIYDLTLVLSSDVGLASYWNNVVEIFSSHYKATRITLAVPNDLTDVTNTPWGLKAIWDVKHKADFMPKNSDVARKTPDATEEWESMEEYAQDSLSDTTGSDHTTRRSSEPHAGPQTENLGVIFNSMQRLDYEPQPLIDDSGVHRVIERQGRLVVLSREFSDVLGHIEISDRTPGGTNLKDISTPNIRKAAEAKLRDPFQEEFNGNIVEETSQNDIRSTQYSSFLKPLNQYEDYEQTVSSPWSQSPAPSPAIQNDATKNPFFDSSSNGVAVDESTFSPTDEDEHTPYDEKDMFETIGMEAACSVIHIPLVHPSTAKQIALSGHQSARGQVPIAILSFMSEVVPYPANLLDNLNTFAPFVATTLSQAMNHSNILHQLAYNLNTDGWRSPVGGENISNTETQSQGSGPYMLDAAVSTPRSPGSTGEERDLHYFSRANLLRRGDSEDSVTSAPDAFMSPRTSIQRASSLKASTQGANKDAQTQRPTLEHRRTPSAPALNETHRRRSQSSISSRTSPSPRTRRRTVESRSRTLLHSFGASLSSSFHFAGGGYAAKRDRSVVETMPQPSARLMRVIVDSIPVIVLTASPATCRITWVNERTLSYSGKSAQEFLRDQWTCLHKDEQTIFAEAWRSAITNGVGFARQARVRRFDGSYRWFMARAVPLRDSQGGVVHWFGTMMDVHDQKLAENDAARQKETEASEHKYRSLAEACPQIVFAASSKHGITYANTQWLKYSGKSIDELLGYSFYSQIHPDDRHKCFLPNADSKQDLSNSEIRLLARDGSYKWHLVKCNRTETRETEELWLGTCTDINDHKVLEQSLQDAKDAAFKSMESKTRFLSNMSHEIRTPLIGITGMINFLLDTKLSPEQLDYAHTVQQSSEALLAVINDILDLSKVEAGMMKLTNEAFPVRVMVEDAHELLSSLALAKELELNYIVEEDVPEQVIGDRIRLRQVLLNIVGNAIKFTTTGEIFTRCFVVHADDTAENEVMLGWEIIDSGPGFNEEEGSVLFKPFSQVDGSLTRKHGGTGLGLVISKQLAELHGGDITYKSTKGVGSTFSFTARFTIPADVLAGMVRHSATVPARGLTHASETGKSTEAFEVLILSHTSWSIVALNHHIRLVVPREVPSTIVTSDNVNSAMHEIANPSGELFTHIVINLEDVDQQLTLVRLAQSDARYSQTKILLITTPVIRNQLVARAEAQKLSLSPAQVFFIFKVVKPSKLSKFFDPSSLRNESMDARRQTAQQVVQTQKDVFSSINENVGNRGLKVLLVEDNPVNRKVMTKYCNKAGLEVDTANDGVECLDLYKDHRDEYSIILMDLHMPNLDGYQACAKIRELERASSRPSMPIIALSANVMSDVADRCKLAGFTDYLSKPVAFNTLSTTISKLISTNS